MTYISSCSLFCCFPNWLLQILSFYWLHDFPSSAVQYLLWEINLITCAELNATLFSVSFVLCDWNTLPVHLTVHACVCVYIHTHTQTYVYITYMHATYFNSYNMPCLVLTTVSVLAITGHQIRWTRDGMHNIQMYVYVKTTIKLINFPFICD